MRQEYLPNYKARKESDREEPINSGIKFAGTKISNKNEISFKKSKTFLISKLSEQNLNLFVFNVNRFQEDLFQIAST